jgi:hypothetical protein
VKALLLALVLAAGFGYNYWKGNRPIQVEMPPPVTVRSAAESRMPLQRDLAGGPQFRVNGYALTGLAEFSIGARVILAKHYSSDREADLAPVDLALAWGPMADAAVLEAISFSQSGRFYHWRYEGAPPIPRREIERNSANMHMIPSSREMAKLLKAVKPGDLVRLRGYLVRAEAQDGWRWTSSLTREDTGAGACELIFLQELEVL